MNDNLGVKFWIFPIIGGIFGIAIGPIYYFYTLYPNFLWEMLINPTPQYIVNITLVVSVIYAIGVPIILSKRRI